jgi:hypothetical protein
MELQGARSKSGLAVPFLVAAARRSERTKAIAQLVESYFDELEEVKPLLVLAPSLSEAVPIPEPPEKPVVLVWLELIEQRGLINPGTWFDQPKRFSEDVYAAELGRSRFLAKVRKKELPSFVGAPAPAPLVKR